MTEKLTGEDKLKDKGDDFYELLITAHEGLEYDESVALNARLVLILANEIGDIEVLAAALRTATDK
ncbi:MAG: DUF2783 domain-containing protein [Proteobacteria bacterium]|nr:DUF2783 domain-containing protein [Pseudomonadota bacterium]